jgi:hypothetical protein
MLIEGDAPSSRKAPAPVNSRAPPGAHSLLAASAQDHSLAAREVVGRTPRDLFGWLVLNDNLRIRDALRHEPGSVVYD